MLQRHWFAEVLFLGSYSAALSTDKLRVPHKLFHLLKGYVSLLCQVTEVISMPNVLDGHAWSHRRPAKHSLGILVSWTFGTNCRFHSRRCEPRWSGQAFRLRNT